MLEFNKKEKLFNLKGIAVSSKIISHNLDFFSPLLHLSFFIVEKFYWCIKVILWSFLLWWYDIIQLRISFFLSPNLQLGNPVLEFATDFNSRADFIWSHGLISDSTYKMFTSVCNYSRYVSEYYRGSVSSVCSKVMNQVSKETSRFVDKYDVTLDVCISSVFAQCQLLSPQVSVWLCLITST